MVKLGELLNNDHQDHSEFLKIKELFDKYESLAFLLRLKGNRDRVTVKERIFSALLYVDQDLSIAIDKEIKEFSERKHEEEKSF